MSANHALLHCLKSSDRTWPDQALAFVRACNSPTWIEQAGRDGSRTRVVVTLLHGNEPSGVSAVARWLASGATPAVNTVFYIASTEAALSEPVFRHRHLPGQPDANRTFRAPFNGRPGQLALEVLDRIAQLAPEAVLDLHNTSGHNPCYGVATNASAPVLTLTHLFAPRVVVSNLSLGTLVEATSAWAPSVVIECGLAGDPVADAAAWRGLEPYLTRDDLGLGARPPAMEVLRDPVRVNIRPDWELGYAHRRPEGAGGELEFVVDLSLEAYNFRPVTAGHVIGWSRSDELPVVAVGAAGHDIATQLFEVRSGTVVTRHALVPLMMTIDKRIALSDCLFYVAVPHE